ncbi:MAG: single-stranded-DNA-specific exonuclease RecJ [Gammaproteobacteria bacterium]|nr:single-stranded-DNA-specific exonuclease RecJ [Gammaproteobacteria bacterium]
MQASIVRNSPEAADAPVGPRPEHVHPLLWRVYRARGVRSAAELERDVGALIAPQQMQGLDAACDVLESALRDRKRILIVGDFDADGATSCALAVLCLRAFGHTAVDYLVPNRFTFGYGLTPEIVEHARAYAPDVIVTVDNGVSSVDGVAAARRLGCEVIVTDHHLAGPVLPDADAIVNPNLPDNAFPSKALAGVGVIFYVMLGLRSRLRATGWFTARRLTEPNLAAYLDLVALGTVADVVPLDHNNRILVHQGLARIRAGHCRPGITALLRVAGRQAHRVQATDLGFAVGPRLNAAGRLDDMSLGIACLISDDADEALRLASELDRLNRERRAIEERMRTQAEGMLDDWQPSADDELPWGLCLYRSDWHQGVIGILASRIKERYHRPVIAFASAADGMLKGSARSIPGLHVRDALDAVAASRPGLLEKFGGHAMAAGMSLPESSLQDFAAAFDAVVRERLDAADLDPVIRSDGCIDAADISLDTARAILDGGPWGQGFAEPTFDGEFDVVSSRVVGDRHWKLVLRHPDGGPAVDAIAFNAVEYQAQMPARIRAAYKLDENEWQGRVSLQLRVDFLTGTGA